jgi:hypothetical protein
LVIASLILIIAYTNRENHHMTHASSEATKFEVPQSLLPFPPKLKVPLNKPRY